MIRVAYSDASVWTQIWRVWWLLLTRGRRTKWRGTTQFPPPGFVGQVSTLSAATDPRPYRLRSTQVRHVPSTHGAPLWRLTCVWEISQPAQRPSKSGHGSGLTGKLLEDAGADLSPLLIPTTSIFPDQPTDLP